LLHANLWKKISRPAPARRPDRTGQFNPLTCYPRRAPARSTKMKRRRSLAQLEASIERARTKRAQATAFYQLGLFHDNNNRETKAITNYQKALRLGLTAETRAQTFAWLASSLYKTGRPKLALLSLKRARSVTRSEPLRQFLRRLELQILRDQK
jgi:tetratricopeptide (TPR) repeat protein